jgi:hypothetical protein
MTTAAIALGIGITLGAIVLYDARGRLWTGWTDPPFWGVLVALLGILALPFYLLARARTIRKAAVGGTMARPGWYRDPSGQHGLRYWDGAQWTQSTSDHQA